MAYGESNAHVIYDVTRELARSRSRPDIFAAHYLEKWL